MEQVWKCDFCSLTGLKEEIELHEKTCEYRDDMRMCFTCDHQDPSHCYTMSDTPSCDTIGDWVKHREQPFCPLWVKMK